MTPGRKAASSRRTPRCLRHGNWRKRGGRNYWPYVVARPTRPGRSGVPPVTDTARTCPDALDRDGRATFPPRDTPPRIDYRPIFQDHEAGLATGVGDRLAAFAVHSQEWLCHGHRPGAAITSVSGTLRPLVMFSKRKSPDFPPTTMSRSPSLSISTTHTCIPPPVRVL